MTDLDYLQLSFQLAAQGTGLVSPNPLVGCVIVKDDEVVGRGYHRYDELKHAEAWALEEAGERTRGATVYVNLEPCAHQGAGKRTPPCARALIEAGVKRVVVSMVDPNPRVNGLGFEQLRVAGIEVVAGVMEREAQRLNEKYAKFVTTGLPFVHLKTACSLDGRIATRTGDSKWITGNEARAASQALRHEYDAILVGVGTVLADDPLLTDRTEKPRRKPLARVVLDAQLRTPTDSQLVLTAREFPLLVFTSPEALSTAKRDELELLGVRVFGVEAESGKLDLTQVLRVLAANRLMSLIVEGGATVAGSFVEQRLIDKATFFLAPKIIGGREAVSAIGGKGIEFLKNAVELQDTSVISHGDDLEITGYPKAA
ncbi:MAG TPA: bifunctional diaminohydroxyphosphoribosylaminopyrimidine deaminase/5-amino-6-(5-phosphoribosylamino)uracil reductase RibD [Blastocatellia bacterium]|nr:bifunctional diaminohydroxyphosphoribosylaminopyrimidine deaminase/5-amino-6-(5-phosphoribosylamino)uracil reductase RibD [Blastocatellia bacterium]HMY72987.1 bifunctional diaminohydroxyphosphoribosylaminopyrimidine deaminase/5-amino-6-(5-phosphoribosylamino)uracil reductase RibD [Blastocatellia bacterium]HMZ16461.1 bifunctional diaminohydroxyphosphoribosylaminopyrimidine deaminase/5-amino-6-(5-phosphoribosylamino)uracil reductase RibD [Blastocatellia bacterium]HNG29490.1 bifunctional diamino